jgi:hypothetical protein
VASRVSRPDESGPATVDAMQAMMRTTRALQSKAAKRLTSRLKGQGQPVPAYLPGAIPSLQPEVVPRPWMATKGQRHEVVKFVCECVGRISAVDMRRIATTRHEHSNIAGRTLSNTLHPSA